VYTRKGQSSHMRLAKFLLKPSSWAAAQAIIREHGQLAPRPAIKSAGGTGGRRDGGGEPATTVAHAHGSTWHVCGTTTSARCVLKGCPIQSPLGEDHRGDLASRGVTKVPQVFALGVGALSKPQKRTNPSEVDHRESRSVSRRKFVCFDCASKLVVGTTFRSWKKYRGEHPKDVHDALRSAVTPATVIIAHPSVPSEVVRDLRRLIAQAPQRNTPSVKVVVTRDAPPIGARWEDYTPPTTVDTEEQGDPADFMQHLAASSVDPSSSSGGSSATSSAGAGAGPGSGSAFSLAPSAASGTTTAGAGSSAKFCEQCGAPRSAPTAHFCTQCGTKFQS
jgi:hypothetical protein